MSYEQEQELQRRADLAKQQTKDSLRELAELKAAEAWDGGDRQQAMVRLHNSGWDGQAMIDFARRRGLSEADARQLIVDAPIDRT